MSELIEQEMMKQAHMDVLRYLAEGKGILLRTVTRRNNITVSVVGGAAGIMTLGILERDGMIRFGAKINNQDKPVLLTDAGREALGTTNG